MLTYADAGIGDEGCKLVQDLIVSNRHLQSLSLQYCNISDAGLSKILGAFARYHTRIRMYTYIDMILVCRV
jgi:hypothetical protein